MFHLISGELFRWLTVQPLAKESYITDWLQFMLTKSSGRFKCVTRQANVLADSHMEWWVLTTEKDALCAYRFLVQAKRLMTNTNVFPSIAYETGNGYQIDLLIKAAESRLAMPLYLFYSCSRPSPQMQIRNFPYINKRIVTWCENCENGAYLATAESIREKYINNIIQEISDTDILNNSLGLSMCDLIWSNNHTLFDSKKGLAKSQQRLDGSRPAKILSAIDQFYVSSETNGDDADKRGIRHSGDTIPEYLYKLINNEADMQNNWISAKDAKELEPISSIMIFDCRTSPKVAGPGEEIGPNSDIK